MNTLNNAKRRSAKWATENKEETMTDQSGSNDTDINLIVKRYGVYGQAPGAATPPQYGDYADLPTDLAESIKLMRSQPDLRNKLPTALQKMTLEEIFGLTNEQLEAKLTPPAPKPEPKEEPKT